MIPIQHIQQPPGAKDCWARTCAMVLNYVKGLSLTPRDIMRAAGLTYSPYTGGSWKCIRAAYKHFGYYPKEYDPLPFHEVRQILDRNIPIHICGIQQDLDGYDATYLHSAVLCGYTDNLYIIDDPLTPELIYSAGVYWKAVDLESRMYLLRLIKMRW